MGQACLSAQRLCKGYNLAVCTSTRPAHSWPWAQSQGLKAEEALTKASGRKIVTVLLRFKTVSALDNHLCKKKNDWEQSCIKIERVQVSPLKVAQNGNVLLGWGSASHFCDCCIEKTWNKCAFIWWYDGQAIPSCVKAGQSFQTHKFWFTNYTKCMSMLFILISPFFLYCWPDLPINFIPCSLILLWIAARWAKPSSTLGLGPRYQNL